MSQQKETIEANEKLILCYLIEGLQIFLANNQDDSTKQLRKVPFSEDYLSLFNLEFLRAFLIIAEIREQMKSVDFNCISAEDAVRYCMWLSCLALREIDNRSLLDRELAQSSTLINELIQLFLECHLLAINLMPRKDKIECYKVIKFKRAQNYISLIRALTNLDNEKLLINQQNVIIFLSVCISVCLYVCMFAFLNVFMSVCLHVCKSVCLTKILFQLKGGTISSLHIAFRLLQFTFT